VILISGAGGGLGRSAARHLARCGAIVGVNDIDVVRCQETVSQITAEGGQAYPLPADLASRDVFLEVAGRLAAATGRIDAVVNNASIIHYEPIEEVREEMLERMLGIGFRAAVWGAQALLRHYDRARGGCLVNYASPVAYRGYPTTAIYSSIKGALVSLTHTLAAELGPRGVRVNAVAPGSVPTPGAMKLVDPAEYERRARSIPLRRNGRTEDNDHALAFLLSAEAAFINGTVLNVDGGIAASA
jgi:NAD(P)-dependent dehydrogenase (short-subunit alcohol dehydrogenase family)